MLRFAALGTTEQGDSGTQFRVDYIKSSGAIGFYYLDWVAGQTTDDGPVNWIIETKGRVWEDMRAKDEAIHSWCRRVSEQTGDQWRFIRINQKDVDLSKAHSLGNLVATVEKKRGQIEITS